MTDESTPTRYQLRFQPLTGTGSGFAFPCDARGVIGWAVAAPAVQPNPRER